MPTPTHLLNQTITVQRLTVTQDAAGSPTRSYNAHLASVKARVQAMTASEASRYGGQLDRIGFRIYTPDVDIIATDRVLLTDAAGASHTLDVKEVTPSDGDRSVLRIVAVAAA